VKDRKGCGLAGDPVDRNHTSCLGLAGCVHDNCHDGPAAFLSVKDTQGPVAGIAMRIVWLARHVWPETIGGIQMRVNALTRHMRSDGHDVEMWTCALAAGSSKILDDGRRLIGLGGPDPPRFLWRIAPAWRVMCLILSRTGMGGVDIVFTADPIFVSWHILSGSSIPLIYCPGGTVSGSFRWQFPGAGSGGWLERLRRTVMPAGQYLLAERLCLLRSAGIIAVSRAVRDQMLNVCAGSGRRMRVIHTGYEPSWIKQPVRDGSRPFTVICVARLHRIKNIDHLICAWQLVARTDKRLIIVGDGEEGPALKALVCALGLDDSIEFLGERRDVPSLLAGADVFVLPSLYEACPLAVIEAMGSSLPCITLQSVPGVSSVGASGELNVDGVTGFCVDPQDRQAMASAIDYFADHPGARRQIGQAAQHRARTLLTWDLAARKYLALAEQLTAGSASAGR